MVFPRKSNWIASMVVSILVVMGFRDELAISRENRDPQAAVNQITPDAEAAVWVHSHTPRGAVVMARHVPITFYYADRKVVWFPPSSDVHLLVEGIEKHGIEYVIDVNRRSNYYLPPDDECMRPLLAAYPSAFRLVEQTRNVQIFQVLADRLPPGQTAAQLDPHSSVELAAANR